MRILLIGFIVLLSSCSKNEMTPTGCNIKFKGMNFTSSVSYCQDNQLSSEGGNFGILIYKDSRSLLFNHYDGDYVPQSINMKVDGKTVSFDGVVKSIYNGNTGSISGVCSCSF